jgi:hypothetical protein
VKEHRDTKFIEGLYAASQGDQVDDIKFIFLGSYVADKIEIKIKIYGERERLLAQMWRILLYEIGFAVLLFFFYFLTHLAGL